ncbi:MAG: IS21-like element helper ATPase IstB [Planctomycetota bacterium]|nr:IS21-like element helper ATPase IstB [Planctomycetota bacterium]
MSVKSQLSRDLSLHLKELCLPTIRSLFEEEAQRAQQEALSYQQYLFELARQECEIRLQNRIERYLRESKLPLEKTLDTFDLDRLPAKLKQQFRALQDGTFLDRRENVLAFGNPGSGKTHLLAGICQHLIRTQNRRIYFTTCQSLVESLLTSKQDLKLERTLKSLSRYEAIFIDDIGYVQQSREQMEVLFSLLAHRYERGSILVTSNLPFSKWEVIFKDPMTTAAAIDRLVHHSVILEMNLTSYRMEAAKSKRNDTEARQKSTSQEHPTYNQVIIAQKNL